MRSSIACARCRRSKVKCVNNGVGTTCRACETTGRECTYPVPVVGSSGGGRRESSESQHTLEGLQSQDFMQSIRKPRQKKAAVVPNVSTKESMRALVDALDPTVLTPQVWIELFEIWSLHYSTDLPFIHPPSFLQPLRQNDKMMLSGDFGNQRSSPNSFPAASPLMLLAFLALTARFHDKLVAHHSPPSTSRGSNPLIACQYYAAACKARLAGNSGDALGVPDADRVQALAMLTLHDWGNCAGQKAWVGLGVAIRYAQALGLQYQPDLDDEPQFRSKAMTANTPYINSDTGPDPNQSFVEDETKRRTFWSLFILDRYLSSGKYRPQALHAAEVRIQLPSSERSYLFKERVRTSTLCESTSEEERRARLQSQDDMNSVRWETGAHESVQSRYIRAIELYAEIMRWSCSGGRRRDRQPPWDSAAPWNCLNRKINDFMDLLPRDLTLAPANMNAHIVSKTSTPYFMMHAVLLLSKMMLHREYIPFIPLRCSKPEGPLDPPFFHPDQYRVPPGFWEFSAAELFKSARTLVDLAHTCHEWKVLPQTPMVGFAIYVAANTGVYAINFPWMDPNGYMCKKTGAMDTREDISGAEASRHALSIIASIKRRLRMADGWFKTINRVHRYYVRVKKDFQQNIRVLGGPSAPPGPLSIREGGIGGGLEEFKMIEATLQEFGSLEDLDVEMRDVQEQDTSRAESSADAASTGVKSEGMQMRDERREPLPQRFDQWKAINAAPAHGSAPSGLPLAPTSPTAVTQPNYASVMGPTLPVMPPRASLPSLAELTGSPRAAAQPLQSPPPMTAEQTESWLRSLDIPFSGDDLNAFVDGLDWQAWSRDAADTAPPSGWLSTIWST